MEPQQCPLPEVASALGPFIKPREEVAAIRRNLQAYLQKQLPLDEAPLSAVNLTTTLDEELEDPPSGLTGVRKAYWKALQANQTAQAKYDALKADLEALKQPGPGPDSSAPSSSITETHIPHLRQKEKLRRLKVLERAYASLPTLPSDSPEDQLKAQLGPQPTPPSSHPPTASFSNQTAPDLEAKLLTLKKAVLKAQRRVQDQEARNAVAKASLPAQSELGSAAKIAGLQKALQELTVWMEEMLGVIADAEAEAAEKSMPPTPGAGVANGTPGSRAKGRKIDVDEIETAYGRYLNARRRLVHTIASPSPPLQAEDNEPLFPAPTSTTGTKSNNPTTSKSPAELLLPHIPSLLTLKTDASALLTHQSATRATLSASENETARLVRRLAGESHLVPPGASRGRDWAEAGREAGEEVEKVVRERVRMGEEWSAKATEAMDGIEGLALNT